LFNKFFIALFIFVNFIPNLYADNRKLIIDKLKNINNITFDFEQTTNSKKEIGTCILSFNDKLICDYEDSMQKRIVINGNKLVVQQKRYNKTLYYSISKYPFVKIFNKNSLIDLINESTYQLNDNIKLTYVDKDKKNIIIFFDINNYDLIGWEVVDQLQNTINFSIKIKGINSDINPKIFLIPSSN
jgi:outer membrane lipoprotein-sorting protein